MKTQPQKLPPNLQPPGYDYETACARLHQFEAREGSTWRGIPGLAPNSTRTVYALQPDGSFVRCSRATYQHDGTFWTYRRFEDNTPPSETVEVISQDDYYRTRIDTPAARGEPVTRYIVPDHWGSYVTTDEATARKVAAGKVAWEDVDIRENIRILHARSGAFSDAWTYWSDDSITAGISKDEIGDMTASGNGAFSEAAERLLTMVRKGGKKSIEHMDSAKRRLRRVRDMTSYESIVSTSQHYGFSSYNYSEHGIDLRRCQTDDGDQFYVLEEIYAGISGDGYVDEYYAFFDDETKAREAYHATYGVRRARRLADDLDALTGLLSAGPGAGAAWNLLCTLELDSTERNACKHS